MLGNDLTNKEIENKIKIYCSYQDRCHKDVVLKLKDFNIDNKGKNEIISNLIKENYLNESRFCKSFARGKFRIKNWGKIRLIRELKIREISDWNIKNALKEISDEEYLDCCKILVKKFWISNRNTPLVIKKKKVWSALNYRGWETELIMENIISLENQKE